MFSSAAHADVSQGSIQNSKDAAADAAFSARRLFLRLTGSNLDPKDARLAQMSQSLMSGDVLSAAQVAVQAEGFINVTLKALATPLSSRTESAYEPFNDFQAMFMGTTRDDRDARELLSGNYTYQAPERADVPPPSPFNNDHYQQLEALSADFAQDLVRVEPQWPDVADAAGVLTSRAWAQDHFNMGTNRRSVEYTFREFMCTPITSWRDFGLPDNWIHRDVDRNPGGNPSTFQNTCRNCHAPMDGMVGAFARFDFQTMTDPISGLLGGRLIYLGPVGIAPKTNQHPAVYPAGHITTDDSWINMAIYHQNAAFGWKGPLQGNGVQQFGRMIAASDGFAACFAQRAYQQVCKQDPLSAGDGVLSGLATSFQSSGYKIKSLYAAAAAVPGCVLNLPVKPVKPQ
jgi:hypothetical protein